ncbi:glycosyltransferase family 2 protein [Methanocaldococcus sp. 28A]
MYPRVSIIILNWNGWKDTIECLESLYKITYPNYDVIIVDNGSKDDSIQKIKEYAEGNIEVNSKFFRYNPNNKPIKVFEISEDDAKQGKFNKPVYEKFDPNRRMILIKNNDNYGYAGGNNVGIKFALSVLDPDYVLLLNNDTVVDSNFLTELVKVAESDKNIGIVGPKIYYYDYKGRSDVIQYCGVTFIPKLLHKKVVGYKETHYNHIEPVLTDEVHGACMLIKKDIFWKVGFLDNNFFAYWEETDFCYKSRRMGYKLKVVPIAEIWHKTGSNNPSEKRISTFATYLFARNAIYFIRNNLNGFDKFISLCFIFTINFAFLEAVYFIYYKKPKVAVSYCLGLINGIWGEKGKPNLMFK